MSHNDGIPFSRGDTPEQPFPILFGEVRLVRHKDVRVGIELVKFVPPLVQQMVGYDDHRLGKKAHALGFHHRGDTGQRFARAHNVVEQRCAFLNAAPDHILLVRPELYLGRRAHKLKVRTVIARGDVRVETLIVECGQHVAPVVIRPNPIKEHLTDFIGLLHGGSGQFLVNDHDRLAVVVMLATCLFHLDGLVRQQGPDNLVGGILRDAPDARVQG